VDGNWSMGYLGRLTKKINNLKWRRGERSFYHLTI
jgi:hypothetical protein